MRWMQQYGAGDWRRAGPSIARWRVKWVYRPFPLLFFFAMSEAALASASATVLM
jgi:hypothetical protein